MRVERGILLHDLRHICDGDSDDRGAGALLGHRELIEIFRVVVIDGTPEKLPQVADVRRAIGGRRVRAIGFAAGGAGKLRLEAALEHRRSGDVLQSDNR